MTARELLKFLAEKNCSIDTPIAGMHHHVIRSGRQYSILFTHDMDQPLGSALLAKVSADLGIQ